MKKLAIFLSVVCTLIFGTVSAFADASGCYSEQRDGGIAALHDLDHSLTESEEGQLFSLLRDTVDRVGFSVCIVYSGDVGGANTDAQVMDYADLYCEALCGMDTDAILLLVNNDTKLDWISTSGRCIEIFTDARIERVFDDFYDWLKQGDYYKAGTGFCSSVSYYGTGHSDPAFSGTMSLYLDFSTLFVIFVFMGIVAVAILLFVETVKKSYSVQARKGASQYLLKNSLVFEKEADTFLRTYVTTQTTSGSGSHSHSHSRSSSHRSSSGGRHGGGGRRR
ncbi:MAG: TPM domain-containing protein [Bacteroides sp.]|nr:TPM domain-containing protein [Eubacterium sp.]MCM1418318.1 TPM domain-containing protein [Roseburia sp.]MCM1462421.1 TPM domain-containing protein [Bacteroides sp.]